MQSTDSSRRIFDLEQPRLEGMPLFAAHRPGYNYFLYRRHGDTYDRAKTGVRSSASGMIVCMEHSGTHIDALCHQAENLVLCGGIPVNAQTETMKGFTEHAVEKIAPIVRPGVLLDAAGAKGVETLPAGYALTAADLQECAKKQGTEIRAGEVVLVRTGNARDWSDPEKFLAGPGVNSDASVWLAKQGVFAVGADNMAWDVIGLWDEEFQCHLPGHLVLLVRHGIYIIENLVLEELAAARAYEFEFVCTPLKFVGATGSPVRPLAIVNNAPD